MIEEGAATPPASPVPCPRGPGLWMCVLASGSSGNCTVLVHRAHADAPRRVVLVDAGLSPRRTGVLLLERSIRPDEVDDIVFTHLDSDHCHAGWPGAIRPAGWRATFHVHRRHLGRAERAGLLCRRTRVFDDSFGLGDDLLARATLLDHDDLGVAAFRFDARTPAGSATLGFATDLGHVTDSLVALTRRVSVLAIESNYCPRLQAASDRPEALKQRITGGSGHLSNRESAGAVREIGPAEALVLLHLSRQCNTPERALREHADGACPIHVTSQDRPTAWIAVPATSADATARVTPPARTLFDRIPSRGASA